MCRNACSTTWFAEIFLAASTTCRSDRDGAGYAGALVTGRALDDYFEAVVDASEEAVLNSMLTSATTVGRDRNVAEGLDPAAVTRLLGEAARAGR
jgi:D-aminopeptidase